MSNILEFYNDNVIALALYLEPVLLEIAEEDDLISLLNNALKLIENQDYLSLIGEEADDLWDICLESYIDECIIPEIPEHLQNYFDNKAWKDDARYDWRGHAIASYDGEENEQVYNGTTYYIYRNN